MTPKQRYQAPKIRDRREILKAVGAAAAAVAGTALLIWMLRPGPDDRFDGGGGGILNRQPRAGWLVALTLAAFAGFIWWAFTRPRRQRRKVLAIGAVMILVIACLSGFFWPGGLLREYQTVPEFDPADFEDLTTTVPELTDTTAVTDPTATSVPADTTVAPTDTTAPAATTDTTGSP